MSSALENLLAQIKGCTHCADSLPNKPKPVLAAHKQSKILIIGQAPGKRVHESGIPWDDPSGERLREWLGVDANTFYDKTKFAIMPMGFCYPGTGKSGDLPPRPECAPLWHNPMLELLNNVGLTLLIGNYAQKAYLKQSRQKTLTQTVLNWQSYLPEYLPLPHPSPRNNIWLKKNVWFGESVVPYLQDRVQEILNS